MKTKLFRTALIATLISAVAITPAWADRRGESYRGESHHRSESHHGGLALGIGLLLGTAAILAATNSHVSYAAPAPVYVAPVYQAPARTSGYYCPQYRAFYPNVQECPSGWMRVPTTPHG